MMTELSLLAKATLVLLMALAAVRLLARARASVRALVLASAFAVLLALPVVPLLVPARTVEMPAQYVEAIPQFFESIDVAAHALPGEAPGPAADRWRMPAIPSILRATWIATSAFLLLRLGAAFWRLRTLRRTGAVWPEGTRVARELADAAGIGRDLEIFIHGDLTAPLTFGLLRPAIAFPSDATAWNRAALRQALIHELEHVRRGDWGICLASRVACALYWFHPLAWITRRRLALETERACDDAVLRDAERTAYAEQLVDLARRMSKADPVGVLSMAARSDLSARVRAVLDVRQRRGPVGALWKGIVALGTVAAIATIGPAYAVAVPDDAQGGIASSIDPGVAFGVSSVRPNDGTDPSRGFGFTLPFRDAGADAPLPQLGASLFTALEDQFGLRLVSQRGPVDFLVIEHAERPTPNDAPALPRPAPLQAVSPPATFEAASVKRNVSGAVGGRQRFTEGGFTSTNTSLKQLMQDAYRVQTLQIIGGPDWIDTARFDITATMAPTTTPERRTAMLRALLEERFNLRARADTREIPVYALLMARDDRRPGPGLTPPATDCEPATEATSLRAPVTAPVARGKPACGLTMGPAQIRGTGLPLSYLANALTQFVQRIVIDRTGLTGPFDFSLRYAPQGRGGVPPPASDGRPSIYTALQEQLGLKLEPLQAPVQVLVVDRAELPSEN